MLKLLIEQLVNYTGFYNGIIEETEKWKDVISEYRLEDYITPFEQQQYIHTMSAIYEVGLKKIHNNKNDTGHKDVCLFKNNLELTCILELLWEVNNSLKHGQIKWRKIEQKLKNIAFKKIFKDYLFDNKTRNNCNELYRIISSNVLQFNFEEAEFDFLDDIEIEKEVKIWRKRIMNRELKTNKNKKNIEGYDAYMRNDIKSYKIANYGYDNSFNEINIMSFYEINYSQISIIELDEQYKILYEIIYFYNNILIKLLSENKITFKRKKCEIRYEEIKNIEIGTTNE